MFRTHSVSGAHGSATNASVEYAEKEFVSSLRPCLKPLFPTILILFMFWYLYCVPTGGVPPRYLSWFVSCLTMVYG